VFAPVASVRLLEVEELATSDRGARGFGSSSS
jgi:dUTPase